MGFACALLLAGAARAAERPAGPQILTSDVALFYKTYDAAGGRPTAEALDRDYIAAGSEGVREFVPGRIISGERLAQKIAEKPEIYERARSCLAVLPAVKAKLAKAFARLGALYPEARFPPVTVLIGRGNSGGTSGPGGVLIGLEVVCAPSPAGEPPETRLYHLIAHEYGQVEQPEMPDHPTLLRAALTEGTAELVAELTTGSILNTHLPVWVRGREAEIGAAFLADQDRTGLKPWLYGGVGTPQAPGDLGYWVGWRIARSYYAHAADKRAALAALLKLEDPKAILAASGWRPGL